MQWRAAQRANSCDAHLRNWLLDTGSLTERLQSHCRQFRLQLLGQGQAPLHEQEITKLGSSRGISVREVVLWGDDKPWVFARSLLPDALLKQQDNQLSTLGSRPLGQVLFNDERFVRHPFDVTCVAPSHAICQQLELGTPPPLWGRRSMFSYEGHTMLVAELFLPAAPAYKQLPDYQYE